MNRLISELARLYFLDDQRWHSEQAGEGGDSSHPAAGTLTPEVVAESLTGGRSVALNPVSAAGMVRALVISFAKPRDWEQVASLYRAVQDELDLPAPALSISGRQGYRLWFSLAAPVPVAQAWGFLDALRRQYLPDITAANLQLRPASAEPTGAAPPVITLAPARHGASGKWSAFIEPSLGAMFIDEPGLEMAPNMDRQADILASLKSIKAGEFQRALAALQAPDEAAAKPERAPGERAASLPSAAATPPGAGHAPSTLTVGSHYSDPQSFLLAVMNDPSASARQRIEAAKALLPYFAKDV
jgi:hypothetical protein